MLINTGLEIKADSRGAQSEFYFKYIRTASLHIERGEINKGWEIKADLLASAATYKANCYIYLCLLTMWEAGESQILARFHSPPLQSLRGGGTTTLLISIGGYGSKTKISHVCFIGSHGSEHR